MYKLRTESVYLSYGLFQTHHGWNEVVYSQENSWGRGVSRSLMSRQIELNRHSCWSTNFCGILIRKGEQRKLVWKLKNIDIMFLKISDGKWGVNTPGGTAKKCRLVSNHLTRKQTQRTLLSAKRVAQDLTGGNRYPDCRNMSMGVMEIKQKWNSYDAKI